MDLKISKEDVWKHLRDAGTLMLITDTGEGLRARPMQVIQDSYDGTIYFFTRAPSSKTEEIIAEHNVCLTGRNNSGKNFISISGRARLSRERSLIERFWSGTADAWFEQGKNDPECAMLVITVNHIEVWESENNPLVFWFEVLKAKATETKPEVGRVRKRSETPGQTLH